MKKIKRMMSKLKGVMAFSLLLLALQGFAQSAGTVTGTITDGKSQPLEGVSVQVKSTRKTVTTANNGSYSIPAAKGDVLIFSFTGFAMQEVKVGDIRTISISLKEDVNTLEEVVAVGYQRLRKSDVTGAITSVKAKEMNLSAPTLGQALVGKVAGVQVAQVSGATVCRHQDQGAGHRIGERQL